MSRSWRARGRGRASLAARTALVTTAVAGLAVLLTGLVFLGMVRTAAERQAQDSLGRQADLVAASDERREIRGPGAGEQRGGRITPLLRAQDIDEVPVGSGHPVPDGLDPDLVAAVASGEQVSTVTEIDGDRVLVEGRPTIEGEGVLLLQPATVASDTVSDTRARLAIALAVGLAGAAAAGVVLARRLARPLQRAAGAALRMSAGDRDVRVEPAGPAEVAEVGEALNRLAAALETSEARQRDFLMSVSHELRTPLTAVKGYAEAMADGVLPPDDVRRTGVTLRDEATRLERLVSDLLDLARLGAQDFRLDVTEVDLADLVARAADVWRDRCSREGVDLRVESPTEPVMVRTDATRVRQIVDGLAENALRVTPAGRPVVLALRAEPAAIVLQVRDGGPGLTDDDLTVAFQRSVLYERYRGVRRSGTGLGLALVAGLATRLGGGVEAGHAPEGGAAFTVRFSRETPEQS